MAVKGGRRSGSGRPRGARNKTTAEVKTIALPYAKEAVATLAQIMRTGESEAAKVAASNSILDRAFGKAPQAHTGENGSGPVKHEMRIGWLTEAEAKLRGWA
jgi:hypothetical protein